MKQIKKLEKQRKKRDVVKKFLEKKDMIMLDETPVAQKMFKL